MGTKNSEDVNDILQKLEGISVETEDSSKLSFAGHGLKLNDAEDAKVIVDAINGVKVLTSLCLEGNTLGVNAAEAIAEALAKHEHFKRALWKDMFTGRMKTEIPGALRFLGNGLQQAGARLVELDLSDNAFGPIGVEGLADLLRSSCCFALEELKLNNNGLGITGCKLLSKALHDCYEKSKAEGKPLALKVFIAGRNRLENEGGKLLAAVFKKLGTLERVEMPQNGIYFPGITALSEAFQENPRLAHLNLNDNTITHKGALPLGEAIAKLPALSTLNLGDCLLKSSGASILARYLHHSSNLQDINLSCNEIALAGGVDVVKALKGKSKLVGVNLSENMFGEDGVEELEALMQSYGMKDVLVLEDDEGEASDEEDGDDNEDDDEEEEESEEENDSDAEVDTSTQSHASPRASKIPTPSKGTPVSKVAPSSNVSPVSKVAPSSNVSPASKGSPSGVFKMVKSSDSKPCSVTDFLASPSLERFESLGPNSAQLFLDDINSEPEDRYLESMLLAIMKVSSLVPPTTSLQSPSTPMFECTKALYRALFTWASSGSKLASVTNSLLVHLGLIKSEDKSFSITYPLAGCLASARTLAQAKQLPPATEEQLWACIRLRDERRATKRDGVPVVECY